MKSSALIVVLIAISQLCTAQSNKKDTVTYDLSKKTRSIKFHEGINLLGVAGKNHSVYAEVKKGKVSKWYFQEVDGKKYEAKVSSGKTIGVWCEVTICVYIPGWGIQCAKISGPCKNNPF